MSFVFQIHDPIPALSAQVRQDSRGVTVETVHGEALRCQLLVGADGNRSQCRQHVQPGAQLDYVGACVWRFFFEEENVFAGAGEAAVLTAPGKVLISTRTRRGGKPVTYCSGMASFPAAHLHELNQSRCHPSGCPVARQIPSFSR